MSAPYADSGYASQSPPKSDDEPSLIHLTPELRFKFYKETFGRRVVPLTTISPPDECETWPELRDEVIDGYLQYTTVSVQTWLNYDAAVRKFYNDARINDCGKLIVKPSGEKYLNDIDPGQAMQFNRVRFEIGTPFSSICSVKFYAVRSHEETGIVRARMGNFDASHERAVNWIQQVVEDFNDTGIAVPDGQKGLYRADIEYLATYFRRDPTQKEIDRMSWNLNNSAWMQFHNERDDNHGYGNNWRLSRFW